MRARSLSLCQLLLLRRWNRSCLAAAAALAVWRRCVEAEVGVQARAAALGHTAHENNRQGDYGAARRDLAGSRRISPDLATISTLCSISRDLASAGGGSSRRPSSAARPLT